MNQSVRLICLISFIALAATCGSPTNADETRPTAAKAGVPDPESPPAPGPELLKYTPEQIEAAYAGKPLPEAVKMYLTIVRGGKMTANDGWFGPGQSKFSWATLTALHGDDQATKITRDQFRGTAEVFSVLDRNRDTEITADDLDWSDQNRWVQQSYMINRFFRKMDRSGDGQLTRQEWDEFYEKVAEGAESLRSEQLRDAWLGESSRGFSPGDEPGTELLVRGLMAGEVGSLQEGPALDAQAPDFELATVDGTDRIRLSALIGPKPVVLVFGNFTCGPFRSMFPAVDQISRKYQDRASFLTIYVREAHPTDGWAMKSNEQAGVKVAQPTSFEERKSVATQCQLLLKPSMPLLVDEITDTVGNAYSGMPARLYVIDTDGRIAYKSGRGPFGFKSGEMEQALVQLLLQSQTASSAAEK